MSRSNAVVPLLMTVLSVPAGCRANPERPAPAQSAPAPLTDVPAVAESAEAASASGASRAVLRAAEGPVHAATVPESPLSTRCLEGFDPRTTPEADVMRIGTACGPVNGLTLLAQFTGNVDEANPAPSATHRWDAARRDCFRLFAVAERSVEDLEVEVLPPKRKKGEEGGEGDAALLANQSRSWVVLSETGPFCAQRDGEFVARVSTHGGKGRYALAVWRGVQMIPRR